MLQAFRIKISPTPYYSSSPGLAILLYESLRIIIYFVTLSRAADWPSRYGAPRRARAQARAMLRGAGKIPSDGFLQNPRAEPATLNFMPPAALNWKERTLAIASGN